MEICVVFCACIKHAHAWGALGAFYRPPRGTQLGLAADLGLILTQIGAVGAPEQPQLVTGSIPEVGDPKLGAAVKIAIRQRQNLYLKHIGGDRRIFPQYPHPMRCKTSHHRPP